MRVEDGESKNVKGEFEECLVPAKHTHFFSPRFSAPSCILRYYSLTRSRTRSEVCVSLSLHA